MDNNHSKKPSIELDARRKQCFLIFCSSLLGVVFIVLSFVNYFDGLFYDFAINLIIVLTCMLSIIGIIYLKAPMLVIRITYVIVCLAFFFGVYNGLGKETILYYVFAMPPLLYFYFGKREGTIWVALFYAMIVFIMITPSMIHGHRYGSFDMSRFFITSVIVIISSYGMESARQTFSNLADKENRSLLQEKRRLENALKEIKTLSGLIPICAHCKRIRNDEGFWEQVETFVRERSEADFSHSICPDCIKTLYPEYEEKYSESRESPKKDP